MKRIQPLKLVWYILILAITVVVTLTTIFSLKNGIYDIFPYFYILPIIMLAVTQPRSAIYFTIVLGWIYLGLVYIYGPFDIRLFAASSALFYIFVTIGIVISSLADKLEQKQKFHDIFTNSQAGIFTLDMTSGKILEVNEKASRMLGYEPKEIFAIQIVQIFFEKDSEELFLGRLVTENQIEDVETVLLRKDGTTLWALMTASLDKDRIATCSVIDITDRKRAGEILLASEKRYRMIGELIPYGVWIADANGEMMFLSDSFLSLLGMSLQDCRDHRWIKGIIAADRDRTLADWKQCVLNGSLWDYEYRIVGTDGKEHFVLSRGAPLNDAGGKVESWVGIHLDITERKRYENRLETSLKEKEIIIKEVHHRVKNNMQVISGFLQLQSNYLGDPIAVEKLTECQRRVRTMALVHEKLYQSKDLGLIDMAEYIRSLVSDLMNSYPLSEAIDIAVDVDSISINLDAAIPSGLIINELLTNALKYAFKDRMTGKIMLEMHLDEDHRFTLSVQDNGVGLPEDFEVRSAKTLGMQLVNVLVRQLGGEMTITRDTGTRFEISFPEKF